MNTSLKYILYACSSGSLLSLPWLGWFPEWILLIALFPIFLLEDELARRSPDNPYLLFNYSLLGFWIWHLFTVWWLMEITFWGFLFLTVVNAMCMAFIWWLFYRMKQKFNQTLAYIALTSIWIGFEFFHHRWEIEWPWLCLGNGLASQPQIIQWYEYSGMLGGTLWILISNILVFSIWKKLKARNYRALFTRLAMWSLIVFIPVFWSLNRYDNEKETGETVEFVLLQPNVDPFTEKFSGLSPEQQLARLLNLSDLLISPQTNFVIGPETCLPEISEDDIGTTNPFIKPFMQRARQNRNLKFILGAMTKKNVPPGNPLPDAARFDEAGNRWYVLYNSALQIDSSSVQIYHKSILVAGVEKMPFQRYFNFLKDHSLDLGGTSGSLGTQLSPTVFHSQYSIAPIVCFESLFGKYVSRFVQKGAEFLVIITNDGWLQRASGYRQHLDVARIRAIESRRSVARSANTGISAFVNQRGEVIDATDWGKETGIRGQIRTNQKITIYVQYGDYLGRIAAFAGCLLILYFIAQLRIEKKK